MTKTQIWTTIFLAVFIFLFFLQQWTKTEKASSSGNYYNDTTNEQPTRQDNSEISGANLIVNFGCTTCHGQDFKGSNIAPTLYGLSSYYDRETLINYLRNPNSYMDRDRFKAYKEKYKNIVMPAYNNKDVKDLGKIADYLLGLK